MTISKCPCGDPACGRYSLGDQGGVGFTLDRARLYDAADAMLAALERVRDYLQHPKAGSIPAGASLVAVLEAIAQAKGERA